MSYGQILQVFFSVAHDPTQLNRQGPDSGTQYRSAIFYANDAQKQVAEAYIAQLEAAKVYRLEDRDEGRPAARLLSRPRTITRTTWSNHPTQPYIAYNDIPKVRNFARVFPALYVPEPVLVADAASRNSTAAAKPMAGSSAGAAMMAAKPAEAAGGAMMSAKPAEAMSGGAMMSNKAADGAPMVEGDMPELKGATTWLNSKPLTKAGLKGKVVVVVTATFGPRTEGINEHRFLVREGRLELGDVNRCVVNAGSLRRQTRRFDPRRSRMPG